ncbi:MAG: acetolactate synthase small subunit [Desulfovibrionales bacterium GWA2_65_9]|nr:MAG: acetolactate synthase small subunit [Desulfovibrionales bacterium GWA2_65_9]
MTGSANDKITPKGFMALRLTVNNHPGVMSHVCGLFARRAFNVEGILVTPQQGGDTSRIWLVVNADARLGQMIRQVRKLYDVLEVLAFEADESSLERMDECMAGWEQAGPCAEIGA